MLFPKEYRLMVHSKSLRWFYEHLVPGFWNNFSVYKFLSKFKRIFSFETKIEILWWINWCSEFTQVFNMFPSLRWNSKNTLHNEIFVSKITFLNRSQDCQKMTIFVCCSFLRVIENCDLISILEIENAGLVRYWIVFGFNHE